MKTLSARDAVDEAARLILNQKGAVILAPTETVYGLICRFDDDSARERIYALKHRPSSKQLAAFLPDISFVPMFTHAGLTETALRFAECFMPGPITLVVPDGHGSTFGFRIPDHPFILSLLKKIRIPLASTSANLSGTPAALSVESALRSLDGQPDLAADGGPIPNGALASTVIRVFEDDTWQILRAGPVTDGMLKNCLDK